MIQTTDGEKAFKFGGKWITVHDSVDAPFDAGKDPPALGRLLGAYASLADLLHKDADTAGLFAGYKEKLSFSCVTPIIHRAEGIWRKISIEAVKRGKKADELLKSFNLAETAVYQVPAIQSVSQARELHGRLYWQHTQTSFENRYKVLRDSLVDCIVRWGNDCAAAVLKGLDEQFSLTEEVSVLLLAHLIYPYEYECFLTSGGMVKYSDDGTGDAELMKKRWDAARHAAEKLVHIREKAVI